MLVNLQTILTDADKCGYAVPAFNVYNMETVMGVIKAAEEMRAPVIMQFYSRLATTGFADYLAPIVLKAAEMASVPVCMHLDHGAGYAPAAIALKNGASGIMVDFSALSFDENVEKTARAVEILSAMNIGVEGVHRVYGSLCVLDQGRGCKAVVGKRRDGQCAHKRKDQRGSGQGPKQERRPDPGGMVLSFHRISTFLSGF